MPYGVRRSGSQYVVVDDNGKVVGRHPTRSAAERQRRALYANVPDAKKADWDGFFPKKGQPWCY